MCDETAFPRRYQKDHSFSTYAEFSEKLLFLTPLIRKRKCVYQGVKELVFRKILRTY